MSGPELAELEEIRALIASGRQLGVLTYGELATAVVELDLDETDIAELHSFLAGAEIELVEDIPAEAPAPAAPPPQAGEPTMPLDLTPDTTTDALQLFFKRIGRVPLLTPNAAFCGQLAVGWQILEARDPESKGALERAHRFMRSNFESARCFANHLDFQDQLDRWFRERANPRFHRGIRAVPAERLVEELKRMRALPEREDSEISLPIRPPAPRTHSATR